MARDVVEIALIALARGDFVVVLDDAARENEGDLIIAAEKLTPDKLSFMLRHTSGVICVALTEQRADELSLPLMVPENSESQRTAFTVSVDYRFGTSTGISARDRSAAIQALARPDVGASSFLRPGHVFPLRARTDGVLERRGHTEAAVDLARLAGFEPAGALCEIVDEQGEMLRGAGLERFAERHGLPLLHIADLVEYRRGTLEATRDTRGALLTAFQSVAPG
jgi:3,4-dihydroxy 2-butanone 4-phosphate synthase/GTP cyclohydrolase II